MLIFSDLHLSEQTAEVVLGEVVPGIFDLARQHGETTLACLGDWWEIRHRFPVWLVNKVRHLLGEWCSQTGGRFLLLPGNHDQVDLDGQNGLEVFDSLPGVRVFTNPEHAEGAFWLPFRARLEDVQMALLWCKDDRATMPLFAHLPFAGGHERPGVVSPVGIAADMVDMFPLVLTGHFHEPHGIPGTNIHYIGSPWQVTAAEAGQQKRVLIYNPLRYAETQGMVWLPAQTNGKPWGPRFHNINLQQGQTLDLSAVNPERDVVRVSTGPGVSIDTVAAMLKSVGVQHHTVTPTVEASPNRLELPQAATNAVDLDAYFLALLRKTNADAVQTGAPVLPEPEMVALFHDLRRRAGALK